MSPWFRSRGRLFYVLVCARVASRMCCDGGSLTKSLLSLLPSLTHDYPECLHSLAALRSAEFAFTHKGWAGGDKAEIMGVRVCVCVYVHSVFVCAGKVEVEEGKKKST